jgi:hypothetical protein
VGCGCAVVLVLIIASAVLLSRPGVRKAYVRIMNTAQQATVTVQRMQQVGDAINKFAQDKGRYPDKLAEIAPRYIAAESLRISNSPEAKEFVYHKPPPNAPGSFRILEATIPNPVMPKQAPPIRYFWTKSGRLETPSGFEFEEEPERSPRGEASSK